MGVAGDLELLEPADQRGFWGRAGRAFALLVAGLLTVLAAAAIAVVAFLLGLSLVYADRALPGVRVAGQSIAGLDRAQATALIQQRLTPLASGSISVTLGDKTISTTFASLERARDVGSMIDAALAFGHQGSPLQRASDELRALTRGVDVAPSATYGGLAATAWVVSVAQSLDQAPVDAQAQAPPKGSTAFRATPGSSGTTVDTMALLKAVQAALLSTKPGDVNLGVQVTHPAPQITTADARAAVARAESMTSQPITVKGGGQQWTISTATQRSWVSFAVGPDGTYGPQVDSKAVQTVLTSFGANLTAPAENASWTTSGDAVTGVIPAKTGRALDVATSASAVIAAMSSGDAGSVPITLLVKPVQPAVTTAMAQAMAPNMKVLGQWSTTYTSYNENYWGKNIQIPVTQIDGMVLAPGQWFDFWKRVVISAALGYGPGGEIVNGHSHLTGALGGGICSCSTTLFNAALRAGLKMGDRTNHYYYISRYPIGLDATVYMDQWSTVNMTFQNDMPTAVLIRGINTIHPGWGVATFKIFGVPDGRKVSISAPTIKNYTYATSSTEQTSTLPAGTVQHVEYATNGFDAWVTVTVTEADGTINKRTYYSRYATVNGLTLVGTG
jgi:vancomycin resistance protein YoaR